MEFIQKKQLQEATLADTLEDLCPGCRCDTFIYAEYEDKLVSLMRAAMSDETDLIGYKLYEFDQLAPEQKAKQLQETPEVYSWEAVYDKLFKEQLQRELENK